jgi:SpoVK/Ycf46/Vps4 family AAA+-type ATPase
MAVSAAASIQRALGERDALPSPRRALPFDAALSSADVDLEALERRVVEAGQGALSFLFTGIPGTGKTAFARHLAERLGMEVLQKRASDLLGMYVGQSEANIADAFREAAESRMFLVFDEADSLLFDRRGAQRSWEISQVNEMLTWMETHPLPFAATSNLVERLDPAVQRRFLFKVRFAPMSPSQIALAFRHHFGCEAPAAALRLDMVTPGDFAVVSHKASVLRVEDADTLAALLAAEIATKPGARNAIGFV